jgi:hypothetical protein
LRMPAIFSSGFSDNHQNPWYSTRPLPRLLIVRACSVTALEVEDGELVLEDRLSECLELRHVAVEEDTPLNSF